MFTLRNKKIIMLLCIVMLTSFNWYGTSFAEEESSSAYQLDLNSNLQSTDTKLMLEKLGISEYKDQIHSEITQKRAKNTKHFSLKDGNSQMVVFPYDIHYENDQGELVDINTELIEESDIQVDSTKMSKENKKILREMENKTNKKSLQGKKTEAEYYRGLEVPFGEIGRAHV